ncbi:MAG: Gfo/Idh/MocA family oxidoreductase [Spirosomataceae bacterium]
MTIGLIGCGIWGRAILRELLALNADVFVFDTNTNTSAELRQVVKVAGRLEDLSQTDGLIIASPSVTHRGVLEKIIPWQLPVFIEKPLTTSLDDALFLASIVHSQVFLMHVWRYHGGIRLLGELARRGELGTITALRSTRSNWTSPRTDTDSIWNLAPHDLTIALEILGYIPTPKSAVVEWHDGVARGMTALLGDSPFLQIEVSNRSPDKRREVRVQGTEGVAILKDEKVDHVEVYYGNDRSFPAPLNHQRLPFDTTPPLRRELSAFLHFLAGGPPPISDFQEGLLTVKILAQLEQLAAPWNGSSVGG